MDWINLHIPSVIRSPEFIGSSPAERGTWVCVLAYACEIECGGRLIGAATWKDRQWQQACGVTLREVRSADRLLAIDRADVVVNGYPLKREKQVSDGRRHASAGAMVRWGKTPPNGTLVDGDKGMHKGIGKGMGKPNAEGEGEGEGEGEERADALTAPLDPDDLTTPRPEPESTTKRSDDEIARGLGTWICWRAKDAQRERENVAEVAGLVMEYGPKRVHDAAVLVARREHRKAWPNEILPELLGPVEPCDARAAEATKLVGKHGWQACAAAAGIPESAIGRDGTMIEAMVAQGEVFDAVVAKFKGVA